MKDIEQQLAQLKPKPIPAQWRKDILAAAVDARDILEKSRKRSWSSRIAWGSLAAVWAVIISLHCTTERTELSPYLAKMDPVIFQEYWRQQQQLMAELLAPPSMPEFIPPRKAPVKQPLPATPNPRSSDRALPTKYPPMV